MHSKELAEIFYHQKMLQRIFGLAANAILSAEDEEQISIFLTANLDAAAFRKLVDTVNFFLTQRILVKEIGLSQENIYTDWPIACALKMQTLFGKTCLLIIVCANDLNQRICISEFYNTGIDRLNLIADFEGWQQRMAGFFFCDYSFSLSLASKMKILSYESNKQHELLASRALVESIFSFRPQNPYLQLKIRRAFLVQDSLLQLSEQSQSLRKKILIEFEGESGLDAGGLTKEWLLLLVRELFSATFDLFYFEEGKFLWFKCSSNSSASLDLYRLCGIIVGLAMYNSIILDLPFPLVVYKKILGQKGALPDMKLLMPTMHKNLLFLLNYAGSDFEDIFSLNHSYIDNELGKSINLAANGNEDMAVTLENKQDYVDALADYHLNKRIQPFATAFTTGFMMVCSGNALSLMRPCEIDVLVSGSKEKLLNIHLIRENSVYSHGFTAREPFILDFWDIVEHLSEELKRKFLHFITGSDRLPMVGEATDFGIGLVCLGKDCDRFPVAHTCFNQLCLYRYCSKAKLKSMLITAISESSGFDLK